MTTDGLWEKAPNQLSIQFGSFKIRLTTFLNDVKIGELLIGWEMHSDKAALIEVLCYFWSQLLT